MNGVQVTFFTQPNRRHYGRALPDWLLHLAEELGLCGATVFPASEGWASTTTFTPPIASSSTTSRCRS